MVAQFDEVSVDVSVGDVFRDLEFEQRFRCERLAVVERVDTERQFVHLSALNGGARLAVPLHRMHPNRTDGFTKVRPYAGKFRRRSG